jgi:hypothetical protein
MDRRRHVRRTPVTASWATASGGAAELTSTGGISRMSNVVPHRVPFIAGFSMWRRAALRAAGFPATDVLKLGSPRTAELATAIGSLVVRTKAQVLHDLDITDATPREERSKLAKYRERVRNGDALGSALLDAGVRSASVAASSASAELEALRATYEAAFRDDEAAARRVIRDIAGESRFREAMTWQNRRAVRTAVDSLLQKAADQKDSKTVQKERLIATYLQRYCTKNDTIGFFGPVGWARVEGDGFVSFTPAKDVIANREVFFEYWGVDALCMMWSAEPEIKKDCPVYLLPYFRVEGSALLVPFSPNVEIPPAQAAVLRLADGSRTAREIADECARRFPVDFPDEAAVFTGLAQAESMGVVRWRLDPPVALYPERKIRDILSKVVHRDARDKAVTALDRMTAHRDAVEAAAGDPEKLFEAMEALEQTFTELTAEASTRNEGKTYAARTLVYEDCRRAGDVTLGAEFVRRLAGPLRAILLSARWYTNEIARRYRIAIRALFDELSPLGAPISMVTFQRAFEERPELRGVGNTTPPGIIATLLRDHAEEWRGLLGYVDGERRHHVNGDELAAAVAKRFPCDGPGWTRARHISPDVMIAWSDEGDPAKAQLVLGEIHLGHTLASSLFDSQCEPRGAIAGELDADLGVQYLIEWPSEDMSQRIRFAVNEETNPSFEFRNDAPRWSPAGTRRIADLQVRLQDDTVVVSHLDNGEEADALNFLSAFLWHFVDYSYVPAGTHTPRITVDDLVIARESWRFEAVKLGFANTQSPQLRFVELTQWREENGIPQYCFVVSPVEKKPLFIDFASQVYIDILSKLVRDCLRLPDAKLKLSEMLPSFSDLWLRDAQRNAYTSEIRIVLYDEQDPVSHHPRST